MTMTYILIIGFILLAEWRPAIANTEIVNFRAYETDEVVMQRTSDWPILHHGQSQGRWTLQPAPLGSVLEDVCEPQTQTGPSTYPCPHELWVILNLDDDNAWERFSKFTLRLSWPASHPTDFSIGLYDSHALPVRYKLPQPHSQAQLEHDHERTRSRRRRRKKYARIRLVHTGVFTPSGNATLDASRVPEPVPFHLILEPLYFGVVPETVLPIAAILIPVVVLAGFLARLVNGYLEPLAKDARRELGALERERKVD